MISRRKLVAFLATLPLLPGASTREARASQGTFYYNGPLSDHFDGRTFHNRGNRMPPRGFTDLLRWRLGETATPWPEAYPSPYADRPPARLGRGELRVSFVGHASFLIQSGGLNILTDPVWSERASPFSFAGPRRYNPPGIVFSDLPPIDLVLLSHNHYDHLDLATIARLWARDRPRIVAPLGNDAIIRAHDPTIAVETFDWGDRIPLGQDQNGAVTMAPAFHWSARALNDRNHALWASYVISHDGRTLWFAGDTGFDDGSIFRDIAASHPRIDLAMIPIGAYEPRWFMKPQHINPQEAVDIFTIMRARRAIGFHWGTFKLTNEGVEDPPAALAAALDARGIARDRFIAARPGQVFA